MNGMELVCGGKRKREGVGGEGRKSREQKSDESKQTLCERKVAEINATLRGAAEDCFPHLL